MQLQPRWSGSHTSSGVRKIGERTPGPLLIAGAATARSTIRSLLMAAATLATATPVHANAYETFIQEAAEAYRLDAALIRAVMRAESAFNPLAVSSAGALGLMQLMPALAVEMGVRDPFDPRENTMGGARYLKQLLTLHKGNVPLALASYNAGPGAVKRYRNQIPPFKETRSYVKRITEFLEGRSKPGRPVPAGPVQVSQSPIRRSSETIDGRTVPKYSNVPAETKPPREAVMMPSSFRTSPGNPCRRIGSDGRGRY